MPNRILREGFVDSEAIAALSDWTHRVYSNLLVKCDDAGRFDGRLEYIRSHLFPLGTTHRLDDFQKASDELRERGLSIPYEHFGKPYIQLTKWQRCGKSETSRYPWRDGGHRIVYVERETRDGPKDFVESSLSDGVGTPYAPHADGVAGETNTETGTETKTKTRAGKGFDPIPETLAASPAFVEAWANWQVHRREIKEPLTPTSWRLQLKKLAEWGANRAVAALNHSMANGWTGIFELAQGKGGNHTPEPKRVTSGRTFNV